MQTILRSRWNRIPQDMRRTEYDFTLPRYFVGWPDAWAEVRVEDDPAPVPFAEVVQAAERAVQAAGLALTVVPVEQEGEEPYLLFAETNVWEASAPGMFPDGLTIGWGEVPRLYGPAAASRPMPEPGTFAYVVSEPCYTPATWHEPADVSVEPIAAFPAATDAILFALTRHVEVIARNALDGWAEARELAAR